MKKFTTIRTKKGMFNVFNDGEKYFLEYLEKGNNQPKKVGYLVKENGTGYYLQEAFFDALSVPHFKFRSVFRQTLNIDSSIRKDLIDNLVSACYQIEDAINSNDSATNSMTGSTKRKWATLLHALQDGSDLETAARTLHKTYFGGTDND